VYSVLLSVYIAACNNDYDSFQNWLLLPVTYIKFSEKITVQLKSTDHLLAIRHSDLRNT